MKKSIYLVLAIIGFIMPTYLVMIESLETGNILLYVNPKATLDAILSNRISTIFSIDLFFTVFVFFIWTYHQNKKQKIKGIYMVWGITMLLGLASAFPLFLYLKEVSNSKIMN